MRLLLLYLRLTPLRNACTWVRSCRRHCILTSRASVLTLQSELGLLSTCQFHTTINWVWEGHDTRHVMSQHANTPSMQWRGVRAGRKGGRTTRLQATTHQACIRSKCRFAVQTPFRWLALLLSTSCDCAIGCATVTKWATLLPGEGGYGYKDTFFSRQCKSIKCEVATLADYPAWLKIKMWLYSLRKNSTVTFSSESSHFLGLF